MTTATRLERLIGRLRPDVVHSHLFEPALLGSFAATLRRVPVRVVGRHHSDLLHRARRPLHVKVDQLSTALSHAVIANSEFTRTVMVEREGAAPEKVRVVYYGLDTDALEPAPQPVLDELRDELGLADGAFVILVPARLDREKGHEHLFSALRGVTSLATRRLIVLVAGDGPDRERFVQNAAEQGLSDIVRFLGYRRDIHRLYQVADLTVLPSLSEAFGQVLIESLCYGTPVVATRVGGIPEIVEDRESGMLVNPADPPDLARALEEIIDDAGLRERTGRRGRDRVRATFDSRHTARGNEAVYEELIERASGSVGRGSLHASASALRGDRS